MTAQLPSTVAGVDLELGYLARFQLDPTRFPETAARDQARIDELLDWRLELIREDGGV